jgi:hypothetical protein
MSYALQFRELTSAPAADEAAGPLPGNVVRYISQFDSELPNEDFQHPHFSYRLLFVRKLTTDRLFVRPANMLSEARPNKLKLVNVGFVAVPSELAVASR